MRANSRRAVRARPLAFCPRGSRSRRSGDTIGLETQGTNAPRVGGPRWGGAERVRTALGHPAKRVPLPTRGCQMLSPSLRRVPVARSGAAKIPLAILHGCALE